MQHARRTLPLAAAAALLGGALVAGCQPTATPSVPASQSPASPSPGTSSGLEARLKLVIDTDMAPDDVVAIASLLRDPTVEILAITVTGTGEAHCPGGLFVARAVVTMLLDEPLPVTCGQPYPMGDAEEFPAAWRSGADTGNGLQLVSPAFAPDDRPAEALLLELAAAEVAAGRRLTILTLGTLTNLAAAVALEPAFADQVRVVSMLGAIGVPGNVETDGGATAPTAEWNAHADPTAVRMVLDAGFDLTLVPLDATNSTPLSAGLFAELQGDHAAGPADLVYELWARNSYMTSGGYYLWDPLAAVAVRDPSVVTTRTVTLRVVEGDGQDGGRLVEDPAGASVTIATGADRAAFERRLLASLRLGGPRGQSFVPVGVISVSLGPGSCEVTFEPATPPAGLLQFDLQSTIEGPSSGLVFGVAGIAWEEIEAFAAAPDFDNPPAVDEVASAFLEGPGEASGWGTASEGPIGVACATGAFDRPDIVLRGPFDLAE